MIFITHKKNFMTSSVFLNKNHIMKHILFIIGSLREKSFNLQLAKVAEEILSDHFSISYLDYKNLPYMNQDLELLLPASHHAADNSDNTHIAENGELEAGIHRLTINDNRKCIDIINIIRDEITHCDGIWVFTPEYNRSYPGLLKNLFDWLSRPADISNFANPSVVVGKKITVSGVGGKNKTSSCREKLNELLEYLKMDLMKEPQTGIELGMEAWVKGKFSLTDEQLKQLKTQAEKFSGFLS